MNKKNISKLKREYNELTIRIGNLSAFMRTDEFNNLTEREKSMLLTQFHVMHVYCIILEDRISYYEGKPLIFDWEV